MGHCARSGQHQGVPDQPKTASRLGRRSDRHHAVRCGALLLLPERESAAPTEPLTRGNTGLMTRSRPRPCTLRIHLPTEHHRLRPRSDPRRSATDARMRSASQMRSCARETKRRPSANTRPRSEATPRSGGTLRRWCVACAAAATTGRCRIAMPIRMGRSGNVRATRSTTRAAGPRHRRSRRRSWCG